MSINEALEAWGMIQVAKLGRVFRSLPVEVPLRINSYLIEEFIKENQWSLATDLGRLVAV